MASASCADASAWSSSRAPGRSGFCARASSRMPVASSSARRASSPETPGTQAAWAATHAAAMSVPAWMSPSAASTASLAESRACCPVSMASLTLPQPVSAIPSTAIAAMYAARRLVLGVRTLMETLLVGMQNEVKVSHHRRTGRHPGHRRRAGCRTDEDAAKRYSPRLFDVMDNARAVQIGVGYSESGARSVA